MDYLVCGVVVKYTSKELNNTGVYGIKCLYNKKIYIGSTINNFRERWGEHIRFLKDNTHVNKRLQNAWNKYGEGKFDFIILEITTKDDAVKTEQKYIDMLEKENLFNTCFVAGNTQGVKHTKEQLLAKSKEWVFVNPDGEVINAINMREFCRNNNLPQSHMINIANKKERQYKGWLVYHKEDFSQEQLEEDKKRIEKSRFKLIDPNGNEYITNNVRQFAKQYNLKESCLFNTLKGQGGRTQHKGWTMQQIG